MKYTILVLGNPVDKNDAKAQRFVPYLKAEFSSLDFVSWDPTEDLPTGASEDLILMDAAEGITTPQLFNTLDDFSLSPRNTAHDYDLPIALGMMIKLGKLKTVRIIGIPVVGDNKTLKKQLVAILNNILVNTDDTAIHAEGSA